MQITDAQILTISIAIIFPIAMLIYSNSRVTDAKEVLRAEMALGYERLSGQIGQVDDRLKQGLDRLSSEIKELGNALKIHELEHHK